MSTQQHVSALEQAAACAAHLDTLNAQADAADGHGARQYVAMQLLEAWSWDSQRLFAMVLCSVCLPPAKPP